jgi:ribosomal protein S6E (S10)
LWHLLGDQLQKLIEVEDELKLCNFYGAHMATEVASGAPYEDLEAHVILLSGGKDKQGSPMKHVS